MTGIRTPYDMESIIVVVRPAMTSAAMKRDKRGS